MLLIVESGFFLSSREVFMSNEMIEHLENMRFYKPDAELAREITYELKKIQLEDIRDIEAIEPEEFEDLAEELRALEESEENQDNLDEYKAGENIADIDPRPLQNYLREEIYHYLGYLAHNMKNPRKPLPSRRVIVEEMPAILGFSKTHPLVIRLADDFAHWILNNDFQADWGFVSGDNDGNICLLSEMAMPAGVGAGKATVEEPMFETAATGATGLIEGIFNRIFGSSERRR